MGGRCGAQDALLERPRQSGPSMLKLHSHAISPFAARVTITLRAKGIPFEDLGTPEERWPPLGRKSPEYLALNPMGKVPMLILDDGSPMIESEAIITYLDEAYPGPSLQPSDPAERARMRAAIRISEMYVVTPILHLFPFLDPATREAAVIKAEFDQTEKGLAYLARHVPEQGYIAGGKLTLADIIVFTGLYLIGVIPGVFGMPDLIGRQPTLGRYFESAKADPLLGEAYRTMTGGGH
jgi:glutathione S-transferase